MADRICTIEGCERQLRYVARGWCNKHYQRWRATGDPLAVDRVLPWPENLLARMEPQPNGCIYFTGCVLDTGYGQVKVDSKDVGSHRAAYEHFVGPIPEGMTIDHECHNADLSCAGGRSCLHRRCVNVEHLALVTLSENVRRARRRGRG